MNTNRWLVHGITIAAFIADCAPAWAQDRLYVDALKLYGGTYSADCSNAKATRLRVVADALMVDESGKRMTGRNVQAAYSYFGQSAPPEHRVVLLSEVQVGVQLMFMVKRDNSGLYIILDGDPKVQAALGKSLLAKKYYSCDGAGKATPTPAASAQPSAPPPDTMSGPPDLLRDPKFKSAYYKGLGPKVKESWLADLDGPAQSLKKVKVRGTEYVLASACKNHDCGENNTVLLYSAAQGAVYGKIFESGKSTLIGAPPPEVVSELDRLWRSEWRQNR